MADVSYIQLPVFGQFFFPKYDSKRNHIFVGQGTVQADQSSDLLLPAHQHVHSSGSQSGF